MVFRIKATINTVWKTTQSIDDVINLYQKDDTFRLMEERVHQNLVNIFTGTNPDLEVIGNLYPVQTVKRVANKARRGTIKLTLTALQSPLELVNLAASMVKPTGW